jgi:hypothetical protein
VLLVQNDDAYEAMIEMNEDYMKVRFLLDPEDGQDSSPETLWAETVWLGTKKALRLMNSPFYARGVSYLDVVDVILAPDKLGLDYAGTLEKSGHSTIWLLVPDDLAAGFNEYWPVLERLGCTYEFSSENTADGKQTLYSVDVPAETDIDVVLSIVEEAQDKNAWIFQIGDLAHKRGEDSKLQ